jgi:hypothetical protein
MEQKDGQTTPAIENVEGVTAKVTTTRPNATKTWWTAVRDCLLRIRVDRWVELILMVGAIVVGYLQYLAMQEPTTPIMISPPPAAAPGNASAGTMPAMDVKKPVKAAKASHLTRTAKMPASSHGRSEK